MAAAPLPGTRWVSRLGRHQGNQCEIVGLTDGDRVIIRDLGGGASWGKQKDNLAARHTLGREVFLRKYVPAESLQASGSGRSFRRNSARSAIQMPLEDTMPLQFVPAEGQTNGASVSSTERQVAQARQSKTIVNTADSGLTIEVMTITPDLAKTWLERGGLNRTMSERRVQKLTGIIQRGEWKLTGEGIMLRGDGTVGNGQHRLAAIVRSGIAVQSVVIHNISEAAFDAIDTGASRSAADVLAIHGYGNRISLAAQARALLQIEQYGRYTGDRRMSKITPPAVLAYVEAHPEVEHTLRLAYQLKTSGMTGGAGIWAAALTLMWRADAEALELFVEKLLTGAGLEINDPILRLRNRVATEAARGKVSQSEAGREYLMAVIIKAWNAWRNGDQLQQLTWHGMGERSPEPFPKAI